jgi:hypothetical protein
MPKRSQLAASRHWTENRAASRGAGSLAIPGCGQPRIVVHTGRTLSIHGIVEIMFVVRLPIVRHMSSTCPLRVVTHNFNRQA